MSNSHDPRTLLIRSLIERASVRSLIGQNQAAFLDVRCGIQRSKEFKNAKLLAECLLQQCEIAAAVNDYRMTLSVARDALAIYCQINDCKGIGACLNNIGISYDYCGEYKKAIKYYRRSLMIDRRLGDRPGQAVSYSNIGSVYISLGKFRKALKYFVKSLSLERRTGNLVGRAISFNNIAGIYYRIGDNRRALHYYLKCMQVMNHVGDRKGLAVVLSNISTVQKSLGNYQQSLNTYLKSLRIKEEIGDRVSQATNYRHIGVLHYYLGNPKKALMYYQKALAIWRKSRDWQGQVICLSGLATMHAERGEHERAQRCLAAARSMVKKLRARDIEFLVCVTSTEVALAKLPRVRVKNAYVLAERALVLAKALNTKPAQAEACLLRVRVGVALLTLCSTQCSVLKMQTIWRNIDRDCKIAIRIYEQLKRPWEAERARYFHGECGLRLWKLLGNMGIAKPGIRLNAVRQLVKARTFFKRIDNRQYLNKIDALLQIK